MRIDLRGLKRRAAASGGREAYAVLARADGARVGVGVRVRPSRRAEYFVEVVLNPFPDRPRVRSRLLGRTRALALLLRARGYRLRAEEDGCVCCERVMEPRRIRGEVEALRASLAAR